MGDCYNILFKGKNFTKHFDPVIWNKESIEEKYLKGTVRESMNSREFPMGNVQIRGEKAKEYIDLRR